MPPFSSKHKCDIEHVTYDHARHHYIPTNIANMNYPSSNSNNSNHSKSSSLGSSSSTSNSSESNNTKSALSSTSTSFQASSQLELPRSLTRGAFIFNPPPPRSPLPLRRKQGHQPLQSTSPVTPAFSSSIGKSTHGTTPARPSRFREDFSNDSSDQKLDRLLQQQRDIKAGKYERTIPSGVETPRKLGPSPVQRSARKDRSTSHSGAGSSMKDRTLSRTRQLSDSVAYGVEVFKAAVSKRVSLGRKSSQDSDASFYCQGLPGDLDFERKTFSDKRVEENPHRDHDHINDGVKQGSLSIDGRYPPVQQRTVVDDPTSMTTKHHSPAKMRPNLPPIKPIPAYGGGDLPSDYLAVSPTNTGARAPTPPPKDPGYIPRPRYRYEDTANRSKSVTHLAPKSPGKRKSVPFASSSQSSLKQQTQSGSGSPVLFSSGTIANYLKERQLTVHSVERGPKKPVIVYPNNFNSDKEKYEDYHSVHGLIVSDERKHVAHDSDVFFRPEIRGFQGHSSTSYASRTYSLDSDETRNRRNDQGDRKRR